MKKKPPRALSLVLALALSLAACGTGAAPQPQGDTVPLTALNAQKEPAEVAAPYDPQRIAVLDMATLTTWTISKLRRGEVSCLGTIKEAGLEAVMACGPDVIFIGGWLAGSYDASARSPRWSIWPPTVTWVWWRAYGRTPGPSPPCSAWRTRPENS